MHTSGSGLSEIKTILGGFIINGFFDLKVFIVKSIGLVLSISAGLCIGKEAPFVHLASCIGYQLQTFFHRYANNEGLTSVNSR
jgi:chloride channel 3/4/5